MTLSMNKRVRLSIILPLLLLCLTACNLASSSEVVETEPSAEITPGDEKSTPPAGGGIPSGTPIPSDCLLTTIGESNLRDTPGDWGALIAVQGIGMKMPALAKSSNGWFKVPFGGDGELMDAWIASNQLTAEGGCDALEVVQPQVPLTECKVTNNTGGSQILHAAPELIDGNMVGFIQANDTFPVIKREGMWYMVYAEALSNSAWVEARLVSASAECSGI